MEHWADIAQAGVTRSTETYIVGSDGLNVKIRGGKLDVKRRLGAARGLELWSPILKADFPIAAATVHQVFWQWGAAAPALRRTHYTPQQLIDEVVAPSAGLHVAHVEKARRQAAIAGCIVELADVTVDGHAMQTIAIESERPDDVQRLACALGVAGRRNESYTAALRRLSYANPARALAHAPGGATP